MGSTEYPPSGSVFRGGPIIYMGPEDPAAAHPSRHDSQRAQGANTPASAFPPARMPPVQHNPSGNPPTGPRGYVEQGNANQTSGGSSSQSRPRGKKRSKSRDNIAGPTPGPARNWTPTGPAAGPSQSHRPEFRPIPGPQGRPDSRSGSNQAKRPKKASAPLQVPYFRDAARGIELLLPPIGKAWHPSSKSLNGRRLKPGRDQGKHSEEELEAVRLQGLRRLRDMLESQFLSEFEGNEKFIVANGYDAHWRNAVDQGDKQALLDIKAKAVGAQVRRFWERKQSTPGEDSRRADLCRRIETLLRAEWPAADIEVVPFGSTATGMAFQQSDLDLCILDPDRGQNPASTPSDICEDALNEPQEALPPYYKVRSISRVLERSRQFSEHVAITGARVPIVKYTDRATGISGDINVNNQFGVINSTMISAYCDIRPELVRPMICFVKQCFKHWGFNDPAGANGPASFNSYTLALLVIAFLQTQKLLPNLQDVSLLTASGVEPNFLFHTGQVGSRNSAKTIIPAETAYDTTFLDWRPQDGDTQKALKNLFADYERICGVTLHPEAKSRDEHDQMLGECFMKFLQYFVRTEWKDVFLCLGRSSFYPRSEANPFRKDDDAIILERAQWFSSFPILPENKPVVQTLHPNFEQPAMWAGHSFVVQDPFIVTRNTAGNVKGEVAKTILETVDAMGKVLLQDAVSDELERLRTQTRIRPAMSRRPSLKNPDLIIPNLAEICRPTRYSECYSSVEELHHLQANRKTGLLQGTGQSRHAASGSTSSSAALSTTGSSSLLSSSVQVSVDPDLVVAGLTDLAAAAPRERQRRRHRK
ncbi:hypothetical protein A4X13_0g4255 [Tilletia indica]|uniref:Poly(A) RNA polymerase mitochondrial-like central palm domain-containing protein n=1 Tax=Tilletia indica TaxID=43049 RepID=A0A177TDF2_9BASI|nr:hypothetical protein A4X13_0g4255 [Tilletia indica]